MRTLAIILSRAGSKGLHHKAVLPLCGRPVISHTFDHAKQSLLIDAICVTTDSPDVGALARASGIEVIERPAELATDTAPVDLAVKHALTAYESRHNFHADVIVLLYGNVPVRKDGVIDHAVNHLLRTGADSVRTVTPVGKHHPDWMYRVEGGVLRPFRRNHIHRRQELEPLYYHDGAVVTLTRASLLTESDDPDDHLAFFGKDQRTIVQDAEDTVDIDNLADLYYAEAILRSRSESAFLDQFSIAAASPSCARVRASRAALTGAIAVVGPHGRR